MEVGDKPGGLASVLQVFADNDVNIEYMYGFVEKFSENALLVFRFDEPTQAHTILSDNGINVVGQDDIKGL